MSQAIKDPLLTRLFAYKFRRQKYRSGAKINMMGWGQLSPNMKAHVNAALDDAAHRYNCSRRDLVWCLKDGVIHVKKRQDVRIKI